ncbi:hypothetical protein [Achromobacter sp.]|uniref:hypothetical protein n=1 Tax=Achromobacter sp. TaxID=134375 RepID=UPI002F95BCEF
MAFDLTVFAAKAKASLAVASTPAFTPDPDNAAAVAQVAAAIADAQKRAAVLSISIAVSERAAELWSGMDDTPAERQALAAAAQTPLDQAVDLLIAAYLTTVKE